MPLQNHKPVRTCLGCQRPDEQIFMIRVTMAGDELVLDETIRNNGRGGYLHRSDDCLHRFVSSRIKEFRSLRRALTREERVKVAEMIRGTAR